MMAAHERTPRPDVCQCLTTNRSWPAPRPRTGPARAGWLRSTTQDLDVEDHVDLAEPGPADPVPPADGWEPVLAENIAYLVDDQRRWQALSELRRRVGLEPEQILAAPTSVLVGIVAGPRPAERVQRLRRCAELAIAGAPWRAYRGASKKRPAYRQLELIEPGRSLDR
jgi:hypothetical protein